MRTPRDAARARIQSTRSAAIGAVADVEGWAQFARVAETAGIESVLISFSRNEPDPLMSACALGQATQRLRFIVAYRAGLIQPVTFVQQFNTLSNLVGGRLALNVVAGSSTAEQRGYGDFLDHDARYARAGEFLAICHACWGNGGGDVDFDGAHFRVEGGTLHTPLAMPGRSAPEIYVSGHSEGAERLASERGTCWLRVADTPETVSAATARARGRGVEICLRLGIVCRPTREEAVETARALLPESGVGSQKESVIGKDDSRMYAEAPREADDAGWLTRCLWTGLVPHNGPVWIALVGAPDELAEALVSYKRAGVTQFILSGWPEIDEASIFGRDVLPLVRDAERRVQAADG